MQVVGGQDADDVDAVVGQQTFQTAARLTAEFLGDLAPLPQGPFILAGLLKCPVYLMFCLKQQTQYHIYAELFKEDLKFNDRKARQQNLQATIQEYAARLEYYCTKAPLQWFNFFPFWSDEQLAKTSHRSSTGNDTSIS